MSSTWCLYFPPSHPFASVVHFGYLVRTHMLQMFRNAPPTFIICGGLLSPIVVVVSALPRGSAARTPRNIVPDSSIP